MAKTDKAKKVHDLGKSHYEPKDDLEALLDQANAKAAQSIEHPDKNEPDPVEPQTPSVVHRDRSKPEAGPVVTLGDPVAGDPPKPDPFEEKAALLQAAAVAVLRAADTWYTVRRQTSQMVRPGDLELTNAVKAFQAARQETFYDVFGDSLVVRSDGQ